MTPLPPFEIERFFSEHEFAVPYLLCASDVEALSLQELLALADEETRSLWSGTPRRSARRSCGRRSRASTRRSRAMT